MTYPSDPPETGPEPELPPAGYARLLLAFVNLEIKRQPQGELLSIVRSATEAADIAYAAALAARRQGEAAETPAEETGSEPEPSPGVSAFQEDAAQSLDVTRTQAAFQRKILRVLTTFGSRTYEGILKPVLDDTASDDPAFVRRQVHEALHALLRQGAIRVSYYDGQRFEKCS